MKTKAFKTLALLLCLVLFCCLAPAALAEDAGIVFSSGLTVIEMEAFCGDAGITTVTIPVSVTVIGDGAFAECSNLLEVHYAGTEAQWKRITVGSGNDPLLYAAFTFGDESRRVPLSDRYFPDEDFRSYLDTFDTDSDGFFSQAELDAVTAIECYGSQDAPTNIQSLKGIEFFPKLKTLVFNFGQVSEIDLSGNPALENLYFRNNQITELDLTGLSSLRALNAGYNRLKELDVSDCPALKLLYVYGNELTKLDVSHNPSLETLACFECLLTELDVSQNPALKSLYARNNKLTKLDVSQNPSLETLACNYNPLTSLNVRNCTGLKHLFTFSSYLTSLDLSQNTALLELNVNSSQLSALDVSACPLLETLGCENNNLSTLNLQNNTALTDLNVCNNRLTSLDVSRAPGLFRLWIQGNSIESIDISACRIIVDAVRNGTLEMFGNFIRYRLGDGPYPGTSYNYNFQCDAATTVILPIA